MLLAHGPKSPTDNRTQGRCFGRYLYSQISSQAFAELVSSHFPGSQIQLQAKRLAQTQGETYAPIYTAVKTHPAAVPVDASFSKWSSLMKTLSDPPEESEAQKPEA